MNSDEWDNLAQEAKDAGGPKGPVCNVRRLLDDITNDVVRDTVTKVIEDPTVPAAGLARVLRNKIGDKAPTQHTISRHRRSECTCNRKGQS